MYMDEKKIFVLQYPFVCVVYSVLDNTCEVLNQTVFLHAI